MRYVDIIVRATGGHVDSRSCVSAKSLSLQFALGHALRTAVALGLLVIFLPAALIIALLIWLESRGSPFFRQERVGFNEAPFTIFKFRTMYIGSEEGCFKRRDDERITRVGRFLRHYSIDELPQLMNVVLGNMCFIGPRPELPEMLPSYEVPHHPRFAAMPGITGLWQVSGRSDLSLAEKLDLDMEYVQRKCLMLDLAILLRTPAAVLSGRGAY